MRKQRQRRDEDWRWEEERRWEEEAERRREEEEVERRREVQKILTLDNPAEQVERFLRMCRGDSEQSAHRTKVGRCICLHVLTEAVDCRVYFHNVCPVLFVTNCLFLCVCA